MARRQPGRGRSRATEGITAIIGGGPNGLAAAAQLRAAGAPTRSFGEPLEFWRHRMPSGMILRSRKRSSNIADPHRALTIDAYEKAERQLLRQQNLRLEEFIQYGLWFQRQAVPDIDRRKVARVSRSAGGFRLRLDDGDELEACRVVVAAGISPFAHVPSVFAALARPQVSHTSDHVDLCALGGQSVAVIGGGQSALESAALLTECGASVEVLVRASAIRWLADDEALASGRRRFPISPPPTDVGGRLNGWVAAAPDVFRGMPGPLKPRISYRCNRPAGAGWLRSRLARVKISCNRYVVQAEARGVQARLAMNDGSERLVDHVLLGTGYAVDLRRYEFLAPQLVSEIHASDGYPVLGPGLESSVRGLYFLGAPAAHSFGPIMRFVVGSWYAAPALTCHVVGRRQPLVRLSF